jgi:iron uptake system EfeUOB component EfeO/EfeM
MREFFAKFFGIKYEFTYVELNEEINKIKMKKEIKNNIINFSIKISEMEYGGFEITAANFLDIIKMAIPLVEELTGVKLEQAVKEKIEIKEEKKEEIVKKPIKEVKIEEIEEMKKLINEAENAIENNDIDTATELYSKIKTIYEKIPPEKKKELYSESIRIIKLYNNIIRSIS